MKKIALKASKKMANMALAITSANVNSVCWGCMHQPQLPKGTEKLRKR